MCIFVAVWYVRAGVCCALAAYVFTRASICVYICISRWAFVVLYLWFSQWMCKTLRAVIVHMWECAGGPECGFLFSPPPLLLLPPAEGCGCSVWLLPPLQTCGCPGLRLEQAPGAKGGWVNLGPRLVCHPPPLPTAGAAAGKVGGGGLFWERLLSNSCHRPSVAVFL